ncbi:AAA family ATPase [Nocardia sp. NPDC003345]
MNRAPTTNGDASAALATGGYDAYFAQLEERPGSGPSTPVPPLPADTRPAAEASGAPAADTVSPPETDAERGSSVAAEDPVARPVAGPPAPGPAPAAVSPPAATQSSAGHDSPITSEPDLAELRQRAATAHQQAAEEERRAIAQRQQQGAQPAVTPPPVGAPPESYTERNPAATQPPASTWGGPQAGVDGPAAAPPPAGAAAAPTGYTQAETQPGYTTGADYSAAPQSYGAHPGAPAPAMSAAADNSRVPDRIHRSAYENSGRIEILPPALASAELLAEIAAVRQAHLRSNSGVRGALNKVGFNLGLSPAEQRAENRRNSIRRQLTAPYQIAVVSVKGGVGRTTTAAGLGSVFAKLRPDRVVAIDANPDFGDLSSRTARHQYGLTLRDLAQAKGRLDSFSAVHSYTSVNTADLAVVASPWSTDAGEALSGGEYQTGVEILRRHYNLLVVDCGTGVLDSSTNTVLRTSDAVVVVTPATVGGVTGAVATLNWLSSHGFDHLIASSMVAIVRQHPAKPTVDIEAIEKLFASAQRPTIQIPFDPHLAEGGEIDLRMLEKETVLAFEDLASGLADDFPGYVAEPAYGDHGDYR